MADILIVGSEEGEIARREGLVERRRGGKRGADSCRRVIGVVVAVFHVMPLSRCTMSGLRKEGMSAGLNV